MDERAYHGKRYKYELDGKGYSGACRFKGALAMLASVQATTPLKVVSSQPNFRERQLKVTRCRNPTTFYSSAKTGVTTPSEPTSSTSNAERVSKARYPGVTNGCWCCFSHIQCIGCQPEKECFYDSPPMPATVSKPIPRLFSFIFFCVLIQSVHVDWIVNASLSRIFFIIWPPVTVNIIHFLGHGNRRLRGGLS